MKRTFSIIAAGCFLLLGGQNAVAGDNEKLQEVVKQLESKMQTMQSRINELEGKSDVRDARLQQVEEKSTLAASLAESIEGKFSQAGDSDAVKWGGDLRYRYEYETQNRGQGSSTSQQRQRDRHRVRARFGAKAHVTENWFGEFRVASGGGTNINSPHEDLGIATGNLNNGPLKLDKVNIGYNFTDIHTTVLFGKFGLPATKFTELIMDGDINPEGIAVAYDNKDGIKAMAAYVLVTENSWENAGTNDQEMFYVNGAYTFDADIKTTLYLGWATINDGVAGAKTYVAENGFQAGLRFKGDSWLVAGEYYDSNAATADRAWTAQGRYNFTEALGLRAYYYYVEAFSLPADGILTQDNFPGPVTNWRGYRLQADYKVNKHVAFDARYYWMTYIEDSGAAGVFNGLTGSANMQPTRDIGRFQVNMNLKF
ncbi:MAG: putative porin [Nitrospinae bacterium]|nr:putative porin [Nitrospinota bacterium]